MRLDRLNALPAQLEQTSPTDILQLLPNPTLISVAGERDPPLFICTLLHGNETTSFEVLRALARRYRDRRPSRSLLIFAGNVEATASAARLLPGQPDFNRIWAGGDSGFVTLANEVQRIAQALRPFASIDIHNNTGRNPHYGCINVLRPADLQLAAWFAPLGVYYRNPPTTQSMAFAEFCPAITIECGQNGDSTGIESALRLIDRTMHADALPTTAPRDSELRLYETVGRILVDPQRSFSFGEAETELILRTDLDEMNFRDLPAGTRFGSSTCTELPLAVLDEQNRVLTSQFFAAQNGAITLLQAATPAMLTRDHAVIRQDCLGYLMRPLPQVW